MKIYSDITTNDYMRVKKHPSEENTIVFFIKDDILGESVITMSYNKVKQVIKHIEQIMEEK